MKQIVRSSILRGIVIACVCGFCLWYGYYWWPDIQIDVVRSLVVGIIQTQAGVWAIAVSFSLLYVQISVEAYSLRAAHLLLEHKAFQRMTGYYVMSLVLNGLMALLVTEQPRFLPAAVGLAAVALFVYGMAVLVTYITSVVNYITPETIIETLRQRMDREQIEKAALKTTISKDVVGSVTIRVPTRPIGPSSVGEDHMRVLVDIAKRMASRSDHVAVKAAIDGIVNLNPTDSLAMSLEEWYERQAMYENTEEEIAGKQDKLREKALKAELTEAAMLAYRSAALMEIWTAGTQSRDQVTAGLVVDAVSGILGSDILRNSVGHTNVLRAVVSNQMFEDTSHHRWFDLREQVIHLLTDGLERIKHGDPSVRNRNVSSVTALIAEMGRRLLDDEDRADPAELAIFRAIRVLGRYGAKSGDEHIVQTVCRYLHRRAVNVRFPSWRGAVHQSREMADLVQEMGCLWVDRKPVERHVDRTFYELINRASVEIVRAFNEVEDPRSYPSGANYNYLDALSVLAQACIAAEQWARAEFALRQMNELVTDSEETPRYAAACLMRLLPASIGDVPADAIGLWVGAVHRLLDKNGGTAAEYARGHWVEQARQARDTTAVSSSPRIEASVDDLIERLNDLRG